MDTLEHHLFTTHRHTSMIVVLAPTRKRFTLAPRACMPSLLLCHAPRPSIDPNLSTPSHRLPAWITTQGTLLSLRTCARSLLQLSQLCPTVRACTRITHARTPFTSPASQALWNLSLCTGQPPTTSSMTRVIPTTQPTVALRATAPHAPPTLVPPSPWAAPVKTTSHLTQMSRHILDSWRLTLWLRATLLTRSTELDLLTKHKEELSNITSCNTLINWYFLATDYYSKRSKRKKKK